MGYELERKRPGRQHFWMVEIDLDHCSLNYGIAPCPAVLGEDSQWACYNTEVTCAAPEAFLLEPKTYRFVSPMSDLPLDIDAVPSILGVDTAPGEIALAGGLGSRSAVTVRLTDHPGSDIGIDKYLFESLAPDVAGVEFPSGLVGGSQPTLIARRVNETSPGGAFLRNVPSPFSDGSYAPEFDKDTTSIDVVCLTQNIEGIAAPGDEITIEFALKTLPARWPNPGMRVTYRSLQTTQARAVGIDIRKTTAAPSASVQVWIGDAAGVFISAPINPNETPEWAFVSVVISESEISVFTDGELSGSKARVDGGGTTPLDVRRILYDTDRFSGALSEFRVWDHARDASDIAADHNRRLSGDEPGLIGYYPLAAPLVSVGGDHLDQSVTTVRSGIPGGIDGVKEPASTWVVGGIGGAVWCDPASVDYFPTGAHLGRQSLPNNSPWTLEAWLYYDTTQTSTEPDGRRDFSWASFGGDTCASILRNGSIRFETPELQFPIYTTGSDTFPMDRWQHIAIRYNPEINELSCFIGGDFVYSTTLNEPIINMIIEWAGQTSGLQRRWGGGISEFRLWDVARSDLQIKLRHRERLSGTEAGLFAYYPMDDGWTPARDYDPLKQGTFWGKMRARNPYYEGRPLRLYSCYLSEDGTFSKENAQRRQYLIEKIAGPDSAGRVSIVAKDPLKAADDSRSTAPNASRGRLSADITEAAGQSAQIIPNQFAAEDYPPSGIVRIGDELARYTRSGVTITLTERGLYGTEAQEHSEDDALQWCLPYGPAQVNTIVYDLLVNWAGVPASFIDTDAWQTEADEYLTQQYEALITEPTAVRDLLKELGEEAPHQIFWDERKDRIIFQAVKPPSATAPVLTADGSFLENGVDVADDPSLRVSDVVVNFGRVNPIEPLDNVANYRQSHVRSNLDRARQYDGRRIKRIDSRWLNRFSRGFVIELAASIGRRFGRVPRKLAFSLSPKDSDLWTGDMFFAEHPGMQNPDGSTQRTAFQVLSVREAGDSYVYRAVEWLYDEREEEDPDETETLIVIGNNDRNINLREIYDSVQSVPPSERTVRFRVESGVIIGSDSSTEFAMDSGLWPEGTPVILELVSGAIIAGKGGDGGDGRTWAMRTINVDGEDGGPALRVQNGVDFSIDNSGIIGGGGGGGGGGATAKLTNFATTYNGHAGGGGAGDSFGLAGEDVPGVSPGREARDGTLTQGGRGSEASSSSSISGGAGGDLGQAGTDGREPFIALPYTSVPAGIGGAPGFAIVGVSNVTFINPGTILGMQV